MAVARQAKRHGLLCAFAEDSDGIELSLAGPLALERHALKYGLALTTFFLALATTPKWSLDATCHVGPHPARLHADASDPISATAPPA